MNKTFSRSDDDDRRATACHGLGIVDMWQDEELDVLLQLACTALRVDNSAVIFESVCRWWKTSDGAAFTEPSIDTAYSADVMASREMLIIPDISADPRAQHTSLPSRANSVRLYAGAPLLAEDGNCLGVLCVFDPVARQGLTDQETDSLSLLADLASALLKKQMKRCSGVGADKDIEATSGAIPTAELTPTFLDNVVSNLPVMLFVKDAATRRYLLINKFGERVMNRPASEIIGSTDGELFPISGADYEQRDREAVAAGGSHVFESTFTRDDGVTARLRTTRTLISGPRGANQYILGITEDMTPTRTAQAEVLRLAQYDDLTGLLNRASAADRLHALVQTGAPFAMLSIDVSRFRTVNEQWGQRAGDAVLIQATERLRKLTTASDIMARVGANEFAVLVTGADFRTRAKKLAEGALATMAVPFQIEGGIAHLGAAIGGVLAPDDGDTAELLRENVDLALHRSKVAGLGRYCFFDVQMDAETRDRRKLEADLRTAIEQDQISLLFQPVVSTATGLISSAEALARWTHPVRGPIRPDVFISLAEEIGLIETLGERLLHKACAEAQTWPHHIRVAVNLSPLQFTSNQLVSRVKQALDATGLEPNRLQLEVTEGLVIRDVERTFQQLEALRALGIQTLIDDFGVGYSSLSYFQRFSFDKVKLDKSFIDDIETSRSSRAIVSAVVGLGRALDMGVVAEGVETKAQMMLLTEIGCTHLQGYFFSRPVSSSAIRASERSLPPSETARSQPS